MSSNNDNNNIERHPPPAKRQRRSLGASDRIVLDVGGTKFITSASTLTSNSAYFASLLSDNWIEQSDTNGDEDEIFIDQDPVPFKVLLAYMRRGNIKVDDINPDVLSLAEFLGIERLLLAVKVRWYCNIGKGPVVSTDDEIAVAFDKRGGIMKAISSGLFQYFLKQNDVDAEKDYAVLSITDEGYKLKEAGKSGPEHQTYGIYGALNGLHLKRYSYHESQLRTNETYTFSRRKHATMGSRATDIFIPNNNEIVGQERKSYVKQFVAVVDHENENVAFRSIRYMHQNDAVITNPGSWLEDNGFVTREYGYERIFKEHFEKSLADKKISMFSRVISETHLGKHTGNRVSSTSDI